METAVKDTKQVLLVRELFENTYKRLGDRNSNREIILPEKVTSEIADDSDHHRTRTGYMGYETVRFFNFNNKSWLIGNGKACGDYPARPYNSDILALELDFNKNSKIIHNNFQKNIGSYFRNSLIHGMSDGMLASSEHGRFTNAMMTLLKPRIEEFVAEWPKYNVEILDPSTGFRPVNTSAMKYKLGLVDFLAESIETVLKQS